LIVIEIVIGDTGVIMSEDSKDGEDKVKDCYNYGVML
jgi:hypothetical protein